MRLAQFILTNLEEILQAWEDFAKGLSPATEKMGTKELRDHAAQMLKEIAAGLDDAQTTEEQIEKSHGKAPRGTDDTAAETHAVTRLISGFTIDQMISEYRALRTSVLLLWSARNEQASPQDIEDVTRFNEAIDQALAESVARYSAAVNQSQSIFLGILGHDLRSPLGSISLGAEVLLMADDLDPRYTKIASRIYSSVKRTNKIIEDLLDFTRTHLGDGIPITRAEIDLCPLCQKIVEEMQAYHPNHTIVFTSGPGMTGQFDGARIEQVVANLIGNAVVHGLRTTPVEVGLHKAGEKVLLTVHNLGEPIPPKNLATIFDPMKRHSSYASDERGARAGLGLGLYIAREIVVAHGGEIRVDSAADRGTTFTVEMPRKA
jgi:signal transduction histidine kinase